MLLKNYYTTIGALFSDASISYVNTSGQAKTLTLNSQQIVGSGIAGSLSAGVKTSYTKGVVFGTGNTPTTPNDYKLSGTLITNISGSCAVSYNETDTFAEVTAVINITNSGSSAITIAEVGVTHPLNLTALIERTVLDNPVTIPAGGIGQVTYNIRLNYPT